MIFKQLPEVLNGTKTQTRRLALPGEYALNYWKQPLGTSRVGQVGEDCYPGYVMTAKGRVKFMVTKEYAIVPKMSKPAIPDWRIRITSIRQEDVRMISNADALAEGVTDWWDYLALWTSIYDAPAFSYRRLDLGREAYETEATWRFDNGSTWYNYLNQRPVERYQAWALTFALVEQEKASSTTPHVNVGASRADSGERRNQRPTTDGRRTSHSRADEGTATMTAPTTATVCSDCGANTVVAFTLTKTGELAALLAKRLQASPALVNDAMAMPTLVVDVARSSDPPNAEISASGAGWYTWRWWVNAEPRIFHDSDYPFFGGNDGGAHDLFGPFDTEAAANECAAAMGVAKRPLIRPQQSPLLMLPAPKAIAVLSDGIVGYCESLAVGGEGYRRLLNGLRGANVDDQAYVGSLVFTVVIGNKLRAGDVIFHDERPAYRLHVRNADRDEVLSGETYSAWMCGYIDIEHPERIISLHVVMFAPNRKCLVYNPDRPFRTVGDAVDNDGPQQLALELVA